MRVTGIPKFYNRKGEVVAYDEKCHEVYYLDKYCVFALDLDGTNTEYVELIKKFIRKLQAEDNSKVSKGSFGKLYQLSQIYTTSVNRARIDYYKELLQFLLPNTVKFLFEDDEE